MATPDDTRAWTVSRTVNEMKQIMDGTVSDRVRAETTLSGDDLPAGIKVKLTGEDDRVVVTVSDAIGCLVRVRIAPVDGSVVVELSPSDDRA